MTLFELHQKLVNKEISALELTKAVLAHKSNVEPTVHAYLSDSHEAALAQAEAVDAKIIVLFALAKFIIAGAFVIILAWLVMRLLGKLFF